MGRRIERNAITYPSASNTARFIYDGSDVMRDTAANGATTADYLNGPGIDNKIRQTANGASHYFLGDQLGSTRALTDGQGNVVEQLSYASFGNSSTSALSYDYTGRERDPQTGLMFYRARWYDPQAGRFISEDPVGFGGRDVNFFRAAAAHCPLLTAHCPLPTAHCPLLTAHCPLPTAHCPLPTAHCSLLTAHCPLPTAHCPLPTANWLWNINLGYIEYIEGQRTKTVTVASENMPFAETNCSSTTYPSPLGILHEYKAD